MVDRANDERSRAAEAARSQPFQHGSKELRPLLAIDVFIARQHGRAGILSVRLSVTRWCCIQTTGDAYAVFKSSNM